MSERPQQTAAAGDIDAVLQSSFGHRTFLPLQREVIGTVLNGANALVIMPTGSGKSLCYQLPALCLEGVTLVISPLIALMKDQVDALRARGIAAAFINSAMSRAEAERVQMAAYRGNVDLLYVAPERVVMPQFRDFLHALNLSLIAIDEAHCISEWGHDFRPDYRELQVLRENFPGVPVIALTATATERVRRDITEQLQMPDAARFVASFNRPNLDYRVRPKRDSFAALVDLLHTHRDGSAIIYRFSRQSTEQLAGELQAHGFNALAYHAGLADEERRLTQERFQRDEAPIIVATIAFGMGVDKPNVRLVVHYDLPKTIEGYYQETGRAGRDGRPSTCALFFSYGDRISQQYFIDQIEDEIERDQAKAKLAKMVAYCEATTCRRAFLLEYFGEAWEEANCGACDVCLAESTRGEAENTYDGTEISQMIMSAVIRTGERFGVNHVIGVLRGSRAQRILQLRHDELPVYGIARTHAQGELQDVCDQLIAMGLLARRDSGSFPTLYVTGKGRHALKQRESVTLVGSGPAPEPVQAEPDWELFVKLRTLRREVAEELAAPAFVVFGDATLRDMAAKMPTSEAALLEVKGVGPTKSQQFGERFLGVIREHAAASGRANDSEFSGPNAETTAMPSVEKARAVHSRGDERWPPDEESTLAAMYEAGHKPPEIAQALDRPPSAVISRLRKLGLAPDGRPALSATLSQTRDLISQGLSIEDVASERGLAPTTVVAHVERIIEAAEEVDIQHLLPPADRCAHIVEAFRSAGGNTLLAPVKELLGDDYSYEELRLVRLRLRQRERAAAVSAARDAAGKHIQRKEQASR